jgi:hypothetical protein
MRPSRRRCAYPCPSRRRCAYPRPRRRACAYLGPGRRTCAYVCPTRRGCPCLRRPHRRRAPTRARAQRRLPRASRSSASSPGRRRRLPPQLRRRSFCSDPRPSYGMLCALLPLESTAPPTEGGRERMSVGGKRRTGRSRRRRSPRWSRRSGKSRPRAWVSRHFPCWAAGSWLPPAISARSHSWSRCPLSPYCSRCSSSCSSTVGGTERSGPRFTAGT